MAFQELPMPTIISRRFEMVVGWDCEFVVPTDASGSRHYEGGGPEGVVKRVLPPNKLISYQFAYKVTRGKREEGSVMWYADANGTRPTFDDLIALLPFQKRVLFVAHNGVAEMAHLKADSRPRVMAVGKVPITFGFHRTASMQYVQFRDTMLLAAEGAKALSILSETNSLYKKCDLEALIADESPDFAAELKERGIKAISVMDEVRLRAPESFERYALHDSKATLEYYLRFQHAAQYDYGVDRPAMTAVGLSQGAFIAHTPDYQRLWGVEKVTIPDEFGKVKTQAKPVIGRASSEKLATACYKGGLNTAYKLGWTKAPLIVDVDMVGAYASSMATLREIVWESQTPTKSLKRVLEAIDKGCYVFAHVSYRFPKGVKHRQTTLGDRCGGAGLVYFMQGTCYATGAEILSARKLGASIEVHSAVFYETGTNHPFAEYLAGVAARRVAAKKAGNKHGDLLAKLVGNGLYGKLGQGLGTRTTSKVNEDDESEPIRQSSLTSPQLAAYCTAQVRCALADLVNCSVDIGATPLCSTTDGAMIALSEGLSFADLQAAYNATTFGGLMLSGRRALHDSGPSLIIKAEGAVALVCRTRVNALFDADGQPVTGAWTGWRGAVRDPAERSRQLAEAHDSKNMNITQQQARLPSPYQVFAKGAEYRPVITSLTLRVDSDQKRFLRRDGTTLTWSHQQEYAESRKAVENIHKHGFAATAETLAKWPRSVPRASPKSAPAAKQGELFNGPGKAKARPHAGAGGGVKPKRRGTARKGTEDTPDAS